MDNRVVRTGGNVNVSRTTKPEAINELSEGLATVDMGLRIAAYDEAKVTILTEGHNTWSCRKIGNSGATLAAKRDLELHLFQQRQVA